MNISLLLFGLIQTPKQYWNRTIAPYVQQVFQMEPLTINGIMEAAKYMNGIKHF